MDQLPPARTLTKDQAHNQGMGPDGESNYGA